MKEKTIIALGLGAAGGFVYGNAFAFYKMMKFDKMREVFSSILANKISDILFGDKPSNNTVRSVRYRDIYNKAKRPSYSYKAENFIFETKSDAENVLDQMKDIISTYGSISITDYHELCGDTRENFTMQKWGWTALNNSYIVKVRNGWYIDLPQAVPLI